VPAITSPCQAPKSFNRIDIGSNSHIQIPRVLLSSCSCTSCFAIPKQVVTTLATTIGHHDAQMLSISETSNVPSALTNNSNWAQRRLSSHISTLHALLGFQFRTTCQLQREQTPQPAHQVVSFARFSASSRRQLVRIAPHQRRTLQHMPLHFLIERRTVYASRERQHRIQGKCLDKISMFA
jgi:hypothetical protein